MLLDGGRNFSFAKTLIRGNNSSCITDPRPRSGQLPTQLRISTISQLFY